jgi:hypothetical protein
MDILSGGVIAGLGGRWLVPDPTQAPYPTSDSFDFSVLPLIDNLLASDGTYPVFRASGPLVGAGLTIAGLRLQNCYAANDYFRNGAAIHLKSIDASLPVRITCCRLAANAANDYGGAIYLSEVGRASIDTSELQDNSVHYLTYIPNDYQKGMGGAIASLQSFLELRDSSFMGNTAQVSAGGSKPQPGSAGGGGDLYVHNGSIEWTRSRSVNASAGFPLPREVDPDPTGGNTPEYFTGDGGSLLAHCDVWVALTMADCSFVASTANGNGGAICISYDSSPIGRAYFTTGPTDPELGGVCAGSISRVTFTGCNGGWQGGAVSADGRGVDLAFEGCSFSACNAGTSHLRDGKGGAVSLGGGLRSPGTDNRGRITLDNCPITACTATGNGGGLYDTIRGLAAIRNASNVRNCTALNSAQGSPSGTDRTRFEGLGGGIYGSAGGNLSLVGSLLIQGNVANSSGGGIAVKTASVTLDDIVTIVQNRALGTASLSAGNGGGIFATTALYDGNGTAALLYQDEGTVLSQSSGVTIANNEAVHLGGAVYGGIALSDSEAGTKIKLDNAAITANVSQTTVIISGMPPLSPSQIAAEGVCAGLVYPLLSFNATTITGANSASDVGILLLDSTPFLGVPVFSTLLLNTVSQGGCP